MKIKEGLFLNYRLINYLKGINGGEFTPSWRSIKGSFKDKLYNCGGFILSYL